MANTDKLKDKIAAMPDAPGIYLMKDKRGEVIYIGKAKSLKKRLNTYFGRGLSSKTIALMSNVDDIEYKLCQNESLALLLEANLVHKYKPKYNVSLRDDKSFPLVKITNEEFPAIYITRKRESDGARYFGPYTNAKLLKKALKIIRHSFPYRSCKKLPKEACIYYRIKLSPAPCIGKINQTEYADTMQNIALILEGKTDALIKKLSQQMNLKAKEQQFEEAAKIRDQIEALSIMQESAVRFSRKDESRTFLLKEALLSKKVRDELKGLKNLLGLVKLPERIEAFDISNISGKEATGAMVSFYRGMPDKNNYRRFRIKTVHSIDDYKMLSEVIQRRYLRLIRENLSLPDLVLIDGGRAHLLTAKKEMDALGIHIPLVSIAKDRENIYIKARINPLRFNFDIPALNLIRRIRDEAHRFAVAYHHILRRKKTIGK